MSLPATTLIGIGNMGAALASSLLAASALPKLTIWNRTPSRPLVKDLIAKGAVYQSSVAEAISASTMIVTCVVDYAAITSIFASLPNDALVGKTIVNLTNGTPKQAREMEAWVKQNFGAAAYFDGGVMVTPQLVGTEHSFLVISGEDKKAFDGIAPVLKPLGAVQYVEGDAGQASLLDVAALAGMYGM